MNSKKVLIWILLIVAVCSMYIAMFVKQNDEQISESERKIIEYYTK
ncbi:hypothetical protein [Nosocomiicoccus massiliensis]|uniref:Uncharacterized protein n=1 Tax=Nosocomiicoccus massiliensis TaxID=1232430 RepID=A0AAF0YJV8_9STAP|nr:hypothetical protein [Nosocomiicoccus massiliensis]WOS95995.1 hypothetical protein CJ229_007885 [Nosocomiicoccus massiliensis]